MMTGAPDGAGQREPRTAVGNAIGHWLRVRRMGGLRFRLEPRRLIWACAFLFAIFIIYLAGSHLEPGLRAARGEGVRGEWVAQRCTGSNGQGCIWYGQFMLADGRVLMSHVMYTGNEAAAHAGWTTSALDAGSADEVYPLHGSARWVHDLLGLIAGALAIVALLWRAAAVRRRRRRRRRTRPGMFSPI